MKKTLLALSLAALSFQGFAAESVPTTGKMPLQQVLTVPYEVKETDYTVLAESINTLPFAEFFSFRCAYCYLYDQKLKIAETVKNELLGGKNDVSFINIDYSIQNSSDITLAYAVATLQGEDFLNRFKAEMYKGFHETNSIQSGEDIFAIFLKLGMKEEDIHQTFNSQEAENIYQHDVELTKKLNVRSTPTFVVNGKYVLNIPSIGQGLDEVDDKVTMNVRVQEMKQRLLTVIKHLLEKE